MFKCDTWENMWRYAFFQTHRRDVAHVTPVGKDYVTYKTWKSTQEHFWNLKCLQNMGDVSKGEVTKHKNICSVLGKRVFVKSHPGKTVRWNSQTETMHHFDPDLSISTTVKWKFCTDVHDPQRMTPTDLPPGTTMTFTCVVLRAISRRCWRSLQL